MGDFGTVVHSSGEMCIVESVNSEGYTVWLADFAFSELVLIQEAIPMSDRIKSITSELSGVARDADELFGVLTVDQLNWKPSEKSWSIGQCFDHLIKTNHQFYPEFDKLAAGTRKNSFWENYSPFTAWGGRFLVNAVTADSKKAKAPSKSIVPPSDIEADIVGRFVRHIDEVNQKVTACAGADREKTIVTSPFLAVFTYKLDDAYSVLVEHTKRHFRQAKRVMETEGFPV
jgi:DinB family protein